VIAACGPTRSATYRPVPHQPSPARPNEPSALSSSLSTHWHAAPGPSPAERPPPQTWGGLSDRPPQTCTPRPHPTPPPPLPLPPPPPGPGGRRRTASTSPGGSSPGRVWLAASGPARRALQQAARPGPGPAAGPALVAAAAAAAAVLVAIGGGVGIGRGGGGDGGRGGGD
jgi:hypothetical protein